MGLILDARCSCGFARDGLKLGATGAQMSGERRSALHLFRCEACRDLAAVELFLGEPREPVACPCGAQLRLDRSREVRIVTLAGERFEGHLCPRCGARALSFTVAGKFL